MFTPGGRRLPMLGLSPGGAHLNPETPGSSLWSSLLNATNNPNTSEAAAGGGNQGNTPGVLQSFHGSQANISSSNFSHFLSTLKKTGLTPNESNLRSGFTPGGINHPSSYPFPSGAGLSTPGGLLNSPMIPGLSNMLGVSQNHNQAPPAQAQHPSQIPSQAPPQIQERSQPDIQAQRQPRQPKDTQREQQRRSEEPSRDSTLQQETQSQPRQLPSSQVQSLPEVIKSNPPPELATDGPLPQKQKQHERTHHSGIELKVSSSEDYRQENVQYNTKRAKTEKQSPNKKQKTTSPINESTDTSTSKRNISPEDDKRKSFLERNRVAASKCRQRKKQLIQKMEDELGFYSSGYRELSGQVSQLRDQLINLKGVIVGHKDCPMFASSVGGYEHLNGIIHQINYITQITAPQANSNSIPSTIPTTLNNPHGNFQVSPHASASAIAPAIAPGLPIRENFNDLHTHSSDGSRNTSSDTVPSINVYHSNTNSNNIINNEKNAQDVSSRKHINNPPHPHFGISNQSMNLNPAGNGISNGNHGYNIQNLPQGVRDQLHALHEQGVQSQQLPQEYRNGVNIVGLTEQRS
ncbi:uncharacterized protein PRCAT00003765001 [Priceomyces carsonii]|uniref:uncharacterized protein n=1 Tax=Priceomyces carsonii TaxID=28549 RepID=UPI002ED781B0|nr:unnamed protein product [Priceomyces carsonii]